MTRSSLDPTEGVSAGSGRGTLLVALPSGVFALAAAAGGLIEGGGFGVVFVFANFLPDQLFNPASEGGTGSAGLTATAAIIGFVIGAVIGTMMGVAAGVGLLLSWRLCSTAAGAVIAGSAAVALGLVVLLVAVPGDPTLAVLAAIALPHAIAGTALIDGWRRAALRASV